MPDRADAPDPSSPERNPLGLGPRDREGSNTGSTADTSYDARNADPYTTGEPGEGARDAGPSTPADPDVPSSDEP
jgi:hypothetical protein